MFFLKKYVTLFEISLLEKMMMQEKELGYGAICGS